MFFSDNSKKRPPRKTQQSLFPENSFQQPFSPAASQAGNRVVSGPFQTSACFQILFDQTVQKLTDIQYPAAMVILPVL